MPGNAVKSAYPGIFKGFENALNMNGVQEAQYEKYHIGEDANRLSPFSILGENYTKNGGPATSGEREDEKEKDNYLCNCASLMAETDKKCGQS